ncbi:MAG: glyoxalase/bleomycin resistance/dioxygenase family protein [Acidimicrobiales bacterium]|nr:glyoxalase/bleomycin resistance/dioxygenase family protein [Acidimicrobiales bacterium]
MSRLQLALNVPDLDEAISFYSKMFGAEPAKVRPGYANFAVASPPLKLVLFENADADSHLNHLGVEVETTAEVTEFASRVTNEGLSPTAVAETSCCFAEQDKTYVTAPNKLDWEVYTVKADAEHLIDPAAVGACCTPEAASEACC